MSVRTYLAKYFTNLVSVATLLGGLWLAYDYYQNKQYEKAQRKLLEERYNALIGTKNVGVILDYATQLTSAYKEQTELAKEAALAWKELAKEREERIKMMTTATIALKSEQQSQKTSDFSFPGTDSTVGYIVNELRIQGQDSPPIGYVMLKDDGEVLKKNYDFDILVETVQLKDDLTGKIRVLTRANLVAKEGGLAEKERPDLKNWAGVRYPLPVKGGEATIDPMEPINPIIKSKGFVSFPMNLNAGFGAFSTGTGATGSKVSADTTLLGYGFSKRDLDWKLLNVGVNYSEEAGVGVHVAPFYYRLLPSTLTNTYVGPGYSFDNKGHGYFLGVGLGL